MDIVTTGTGPPVVLVPGLDGRWEHLRPAIDALAASFRVITFGLCGEQGSERQVDPARGLENYVMQVIEVLDDLRLHRAVVCGVSFGGLIALRVAASHPARCAGLVLVSTPDPDWRLSGRHAFYARAPWLLGPLFLMEAPLRLRRELVSAFPRRAERWRFLGEQLAVLLRSPLSLARMGERARFLATMMNGSGFAAQITAPTLLVTGEPGLDRVTPVGGRQADGPSGYACLIQGARTAVIERTGHLGLLTRPERFAAIVREFVRESVGSLDGEKNPHAA